MAHGMAAVITVLCALSLFTGAHSAPSDADDIHSGRWLLQDGGSKQDGGKQKGMMGEERHKDANVSLAVQFLQASGLKVDKSTIFAPTNKAFASLARRLNLNSTAELLKPALLNTSVAMLKLHVIPDQVIRAQAIPAGVTSLRTVAGQNITITKTMRDVEVKGPGNPKPADVVATDVMLGTNIVHVIDKVLLATPIA